MKCRHLSRVDGQGEVFQLFEEGQLVADVDHPRVDGVRNGKVDQLAGNNDILELKAYLWIFCPTGKL